MADLCQHRSLEDALRRLYPPHERHPQLMTLELTRRCNFACGHCYCRLPAEGPTPRPELTTEQWRRIIGEAVDMGVLFTLFTGGEPLLRDDFREVWQFARSRGLIAVLFTNGLLVDEDMAAFLAEWTPRLVSVTLYGASEETYQKVTGRAGMHRRALAAVELLRDHGLMVDVKSIITRHTVHEFEALREQSARYQEAFRWDAELLAPYHEGGGDPHQERLTTEQLMAVELQDEVRTAEWRKIAAQWQPARPMPDTPFRCLVGTQDFHADPYGMMLPCLGMEAVRLNALEMGVQGAWEALPEAIAAVIGPPGPCQECALPPICRQCPADNLMEGVPTGQPLAWRCELAQLRARTFGVPAKPPV